MDINYDPFSYANIGYYTILGGAFMASVVLPWWITSKFCNWLWGDSQKKFEKSLEEIFRPDIYLGEMRGSTEIFRREMREESVALKQFVETMCVIKNSPQLKEIYTKAGQTTYDPCEILGIRRNASPEEELRAFGIIYQECVTGNKIIDDERLTLVARALVDLQKIRIPSLQLAKT